MTQTAFNRDGVLSVDERVTSARKCIQILDAQENCTDDMRAKDYDFYISQRAEAKRVDYAPSERVLAWLRDLVEKYAQ